MTVFDVIDILIMSFLIYRLLVLLRGTRAIPMGLGLFSLLILYVIAQRVGLPTISWFMGRIFGSFVLVVIILFQHEIRRFLTTLFQTTWIKKTHEVRKDIEEIVLATITMSSKRIGALMVLQRNVGLESYIDTGIRLDARLSYDLLISIFIPGGPLHDGAVIIQNNRILAASCFLPLTNNPYLAHTLGTRHRAGIGITEESDALAVIVSEETGRISLADGGKIKMNLTATQLRDLLKEKFQIKEETKTHSYVPAPVPSESMPPKSSS